MNERNIEHSGDFIPVTTDEGRLRQLVDYLEEHVTVFSEAPAMEPPETDVQAARDRVNDVLARRDDSVVHAAMLVLGAGVNHMLPMVAYLRPETSWEDIALQAGEHITTATVFTPSEPTGACVIALHGGPWWAGDGVARENTFSPDCAALAERSGAVVVDLDYRLGPEHSMDATVVDILEALTWARSHQGIDPDKIVLWANDSSVRPALAADPEVALFAVTNPVLPDADITADRLSHIQSVYVQTGTHDVVTTGGDALLAAAEAKGIPASAAEFLSTHEVIPPAERRKRLTELARAVVESTGTSRDIAADPVGDYDKDVIDRENEELRESGAGVMPEIPDHLK